MDEINKLFRKSEIKSVREFHGYISNNKILVYVPVTHVEIVAEAMSKAGAGVIGDYTSCSFRTRGTGTFTPSKNSDPFEGTPGKKSFTDEYKLEIECSEENLDDAVNAMINAHPYEETAYEIVTFRKLSNKPSGKIIEFKLELSFNKLLEKLKIETDKSRLGDFHFSKAAFCSNKSADVLKRAKALGAEIFIHKEKTKYNIYIL